MIFPAVWKQYNKMAVLHFFLVNSSLYILYGYGAGLGNVTQRVYTPHPPYSPYWTSELLTFQPNEILDLRQLFFSIIWRLSLG